MDRLSCDIEFRDLSIGYGKVELISSINYRSQGKGFVVLLGANGRGKSTLLKTVSGLLKPVKGEVIVGGKGISELDVSTLAKIISFQPGNITVPNEVTVQDLLEYARIPYLGSFKQMGDKDAEVIFRVIEELDLDRIKERSYMSLSEGQKQMVNIARSLIQETPIIILDEPTAHLDVQNKRKVYLMLKNIAEIGKLVIVTSHDLYEALEYSTELWVIAKDGKFEVLQNSEGLDVESVRSLLFD